MTEQEIIESYWIGLQRTKSKGKHLYNFYRKLFGQPYSRASLLSVIGIEGRYGSTNTFKSICDLLEWDKFVPTRNVAGVLDYVTKRRFEHNQMAENQPEMEDLTEYMKGLANVR